MKKQMTLVEIKEFYGEERCFETGTSFFVNDFGKYRPNITFVVPKVYDLGKDEKPMNPLRYVEDSEITGNMNIDFDGSAAFIFGDFWRSKKGGACFRPRSPLQAKHLLIRVDWGGCFNKHRGNCADEVKDIDDLLYFRRASSNGGGSGYDYWVLPVGYTRLIYDEEIDGSINGDNAGLFEERAKRYRKKHADLQAMEVEEADIYLRKKAASEEASKASKSKFIGRLTEIQSELAELHRPKKFGTYWVDEISFAEVYFKMGYNQYLYDEKGLMEAENYLAHTKERIVCEEARKQAELDAREAFEPKYEELRSRIEKNGWELFFNEKAALVKNPAKVRTSRYWNDDGVTEYPYSLDGLEAFREKVKEEADRIAEEEMRTRNAERIHDLLATSELPEKLWFLFEGSEDLDSVILEEVKAIMWSVSVEKDEMDMHELCCCGYSRRCGAIQRVLKRAGGGIVKLNIGGQDGSRELAWFIATGE